MVGKTKILETFPNPKSTGTQVYTFESDELTTNCPFDFGGPDHYRFVLRYVPDERCLESRSLKEFLESLRDIEITAERLGAEFHDTLVELINPEKLYLRLEQARRGGIEETVEIGDTSLRSG